MGKKMDKKQYQEKYGSPIPDEGFYSRPKSHGRAKPKKLRGGGVAIKGNNFKGVF